jgi:excisionase family DNA binding protein
VSERNWATREQAADHLGVHPNTIDRWRTDGLITAYRAGPRLLRYDINEIDAALAATNTGDTN